MTEAPPAVPPTLKSDGEQVGCLHVPNSTSVVSKIDGRTYFVYSGKTVIAQKKQDRETREQLAAIPRTLRLLRPADGDVIEIRALGRNKFSSSGYFNDVAQAAQAALACDSRPRVTGVYAVLNQVNPLCFARSPNDMTDYGEPSTSDNDITRRRWIPLDFDPVRPAGVGATGEQVTGAETAAEHMRAMLAEQFNWPEPVKAVSGNGAYLLYAIDLPNDEEVRDIIAAALKVIDTLLREANEVTPVKVRLDQTMLNAARILRVLATTNRKGHPTPSQPHRRSRLVAIPEPLTVLTLGAIKTPGREALGRQHSNTLVREQLYHNSHRGPQDQRSQVWLPDPAPRNTTQDPRGRLAKTSRQTTFCSSLRQAALAREPRRGVRLDQSASTGSAI
jgi:hypothetical protein